MEFPDLGEHCSLKECRQLDFLPIKCSSCKQIFCSNHFRFEAHHCPVASEEEQKSSATSQDPVCPLCNRPVPIKAGESADYKVSEHIDKNCASEEREKVFKNRCSVGGCKRRELMPLTCESCRLNHCLSHRHPSDHQCKGPPPQNRANASTTTKAAQQAFAKGLNSGSQLLNSVTQRGATAYENIRSSVASTFANSGGGFQQPRLFSRPAPSPAAAAAAAAASARAAAAVQQQPNGPTVASSPSVSANFNSLQGNLSEEEALSIAIQQSLDVSNNRTGGAAGTGHGSSAQSNQSDQKCQVS